MTEYDVVIVGARVAGASLALLLGQQGRRVLLVDRDRFPSDTLSTHALQPPTVAALRRLGVLADVEALGLRRITRSRTVVEDCAVEAPLPGAPAAYALAPRRDQLDNILIDHARNQPSVTFCERTRAERLLWEDGRVVGVTLRGPTGECEDVRARVVVGADVKHSRVAKWVGARRYYDVPALRPVYYAYYRGIAALPEPALEVFLAGGHIGFIIPMQPGVDCLALEIQPAEFARFRHDPAGCFEARMRALLGMTVRLSDARRDGPVYGTRGVENFFRVPSGPGWVLTGDAAYCKDPCTGLGIGDAFTQAFLLAGALDATFAGAGWNTTLDTYQRTRDEKLMPLYQATLAFARQEAVSAGSLAWLRATLGNSGYAGMLAAGFPAAVTAPDVLSSQARRGLERTARAFAEPDTRMTSSAVA